MSNDESSRKRNKVRDNQRKPLTRRGPLYVPQDDLDPNYVYRFVVDSPNRPYAVREKQEMGYDFVPQSEAHSLKGKTGDDKVTDPRSIPSGHGATSYLMRIPKDQYEEAQKQKAIENAEIQEAIGKKLYNNRPEYGGLDLDIKPE